jgi:hypothetical protein
VRWITEVGVNLEYNRRAPEVAKNLDRAELGTELPAGDRRKPQQFGFHREVRPGAGRFPGRLPLDLRVAEERHDLIAVMKRRAPVWLLAAAALAFAAAGCAGRTPGAAAVDRAGCAREAVRLLVPISLLAAPETGASVVALLPAGAYVYPCQDQGEFAGVMHPRPGERVDCSARSEDSVCPTGWARRPLQIDLLG